MFAVTSGIMQTKEPTITAMSDAGTFFKSFGQTIRIASPNKPMPNAQGLKVEKCSKINASFSVVSMATVPAG